MLVRDTKRAVLLLCPLVALLLLSVSFWRADTESLRKKVDSLLWSPKPSGDGTTTSSDSNVDGGSEKTVAEIPEPTSDSHGRPAPLPPHDAWREIFSASTTDKKFFEIRFGGLQAFNPNIIPHPTRNDTWIIIGQKWVAHDLTKLGFTAHEIGCNAQFIADELRCIDEPEVLPIKPTKGKNLCKAKWELLNLNEGPHDARVFYGPKKPYIIFGSNSDFSCFGMWMQDLRELVPWPAEPLADKTFRKAIELQRPPPVGHIEKNWFLFWDKDDRMYAHHDIFPKRSFAALRETGLVDGPDMARRAQQNDEKCLSQYLPKLPEHLESIHQATNSLKITLCKRSDAHCKADDSNTFIMTIIQHKKYYKWHGEYEPYVVLFRQSAPFELYAISKKPFWISGRERKDAEDWTSMVYVTSIGWKEHGLKYHAYMDDVLFLGFGIEDSRAGGIDMRAEDLLQDLGLCSTAA
ncbi:hypothetical protein QBC35DRAFT_93236 [Podospora australis]|uniref:Uncharacterized protein n=1 Tax=Podospora australis TaxID=1536484 RepID=A0AAN6WLL7_9PEZI|nr:hypothetical protein QBC35DRAFT_93236 [Podospora australis]